VLWETVRVKGAMGTNGWPQGTVEDHIVPWVTVRSRRGLQKSAGSPEEAWGASGGRKQLWGTMRSPRRPWEAAWSRREPWGLQGAAVAVGSCGGPCRATRDHKRSQEAMRGHERLREAVWEHKGLQGLQVIVGRHGGLQGSVGATV
jgi:hypothetical protein